MTGCEENRSMPEPTINNQTARFLKRTTDLHLVRFQAGSGGCAQQPTSASVAWCHNDAYAALSARPPSFSPRNASRTAGSLRLASSGAERSASAVAVVSISCFQTATPGNDEQIAFYTRPQSLNEMIDHTLGCALDPFDMDLGTVRRRREAEEG